MHRVACQEHQEDMLEPPEAGSEQRDVPALSPAEHIRSEDPREIGGKKQK